MIFFFLLRLNTAQHSTLTLKHTWGISWNHESHYLHKGFHLKERLLLKCLKQSCFFYLKRTQSKAREAKCNNLLRESSKNFYFRTERRSLCVFLAGIFLETPVLFRDTPRVRFSANNAAIFRELRWARKRDFRVDVDVLKPDSLRFFFAAALSLARKRPSIIN